MVVGLCNLVKIVLKPVAIVSAVSRVVARTDVNKAMSSSTSPPAALNAPPARLIATPISEDSTAKFAATTLIFPNRPSSCLASMPNCLIAATAISAVSAMLSNVGANSVLAKACIAILVSFIERPVCLRIRDVLAKADELTPKLVATPLMAFSKVFISLAVAPLT